MTKLHMVKRTVIGMVKSLVKLLLIPMKVPVQDWSTSSKQVMVRSSGGGGCGTYGGHEGVRRV